MEWYEKVAMIILYILSIIGVVFGWYVIDCLAGEGLYSHFKNLKERNERI